MNDLDLYKSDALKSIAESSDCRILAIDGKAVLAEKFSSQSANQTSPTNSPTNQEKSFFVFAIALIFGLGVWSGISYQANKSAEIIKLLQAEKLILENKISKIRDLIAQ